MLQLTFFKIFPFPNYSKSLPIQEKLYELHSICQGHSILGHSILFRQEVPSGGGPRM